MNAARLYRNVALLLSFLLIATAGCFNFATHEEVIEQGNERLTPVQSPSGTPEAPKTPLASEQFSTFYVSKAGNNKGGTSWTTAWNELDQIEWDEINPGDTIVIAGGEYHTPMDVKQSGAPGRPITITTDGEQVILDGQRPSPPYCGQPDFISVPGGNAIYLEGQSHIVIDGKNWRGIVIRNHVKGIRLRQRSSDIIVRNVEMYDNGWADGSGFNTSPDGPGVDLGGSDILFERVIIHDNGQDAFQVGWGIWNFTLRDSWLYNSREHPIMPGKSFNYCSHTDGLQIYDGGLQGPVLIENSIIGPSFTQGVIIGSKATVDNVVIRNTLFVGSDNAGIIISDGGQSSNWTVENVTIVQDALHESWSSKMNGHGHQIKDSIFWGGSWGIGIFNWSEASSNFNWLTPDRYDVAAEIDPMFVDDDYSLVQGEGFADFDFTVQNPAIPPGMGSSITSVRELLDQLPNTSKKQTEAQHSESLTLYLQRKRK